MKNIMNNQLFFGEVFEKLFLGYNFIKLEGGIGLDFLRSEKLIVDFATLFVVLCNGCFVIFFFLSYLLLRFIKGVMCFYLLIIQLLLKPTLPKQSNKVR